MMSRRIPAGDSDKLKLELETQCANPNLLRTEPDVTMGDCRTVRRETLGAAASEVGTNLKNSGSVDGAGLGSPDSKTGKAGLHRLLEMKYNFKIFGLENNEKTAVEFRIRTSRPDLL